MVLNNKGQVFIYTMMLGICCIVMGLALAPVVQSIVNEKMSEMTCTSPADNWTQATCWILDSYKPLAIGGIIFVGISYLAARNYFGQ